jgi:protein-disulfide isomerase/uncharacterized membrane protein
MNSKDHDRLFAIFLLSLLGLLDAGWLSTRSMGIRIRGMCGPVGDCDTVLASQFGHVAGIPLGVFGLIMYAAVIILVYRVSVKPERERLYAPLRWLSGTGVILSVGLMVVQGFVIKAFCLFCTLSAVTVTIIALLSLRLGKGSSGAGVGGATHRFRAALYSGVVFLYGLFLAAIWSGQQERSTIVGRIGNEVLREERMKRELAIFAAENERQLLEAQIAWVSNTLVQRMLEKEADHRNMTTAELAREVVGVVPTVTDSEFQAAVHGLSGTTHDLTPVEQEQLRNLLIQQKQDARLSRYVDSLRIVYGFAVDLEPIPVVNPLLDLSSTASFGAKDPQATLVVFTDFQCPFCAGVANLLDEIVRRNPRKVAVYIKNLPLGMHPNAARAAEASLCAHAQGKFKTFHDLLFTHQASLDDASLMRYAQSAGCDTAAFSACLKTGFYRQFVERDIAEARRNGITGTPTVFLNGRPLMGELSLERLQSELQDVLR